MKNSQVNGIHPYEQYTVVGFNCDDVQFLVAVDVDGDPFAVHDGENWYMLNYFDNDEWVQYTLDDGGERANETRCSDQVKDLIGVSEEIVGGVTWIEERREKGQLSTFALPVGFPDLDQ
jgi:S-adenosylhomocysteine hydrolase